MFLKDFQNVKYYFSDIILLRKLIFKKIGSYINHNISKKKYIK